MEAKVELWMDGFSAKVKSFAKEKQVAIHSESLQVVYIVYISNIE